MNSAGIDAPLMDGRVLERAAQQRPHLTVILTALLQLLVVVLATLLPFAVDASGEKVYVWKTRDRMVRAMSALALVFAVLSFAFSFSPRLRVLDFITFFFTFLFSLLTLIYASEESERHPGGHIRVGGVTLWSVASTLNLGLFAFVTTHYLRFFVDKQALAEKRTPLPGETDSALQPGACLL